MDRQQRVQMVVSVSMKDTFPFRVQRLTVIQQLKMLNVHLETEHDTNYIK